MKLFPRDFFRDLCLAGLLMTLTSDVQGQQNPYDHEHPFTGRRASSESDRLMGLYYLSQCRVSLATYWLEAAVEHDPRNTSAKLALGSIKPWAKEESESIYQKAVESGSTDLADYVLALSCDPNNAKAQRQIDAILKARDKAHVAAAKK
jgi:Tfp pilus assembly protein PilF